MRTDFNGKREPFVLSKMLIVHKENCVCTTTAFKTRKRRDSFSLSLLCGLWHVMLTINKLFPYLKWHLRLNTRKIDQSEQYSEEEADVTSS